MAAVSKARLLDLAKLQSNIFGTTWNPTQQRIGTSVLAARLKGPQLAAYYPRRGPILTDIKREIEQRDGLELPDEAEDWRNEGLQIAKLRGKGVPKKKRTADTTKKGKKKR